MMWGGVCKRWLEEGGGGGGDGGYQGLDIVERVLHVSWRWIQRGQGLVQGYVCADVVGQNDGDGEYCQNEVGMSNLFYH